MCAATLIINSQLNLNWIQSNIYIFFTLWLILIVWLTTSMASIKFDWSNLQFSNLIGFKLKLFQTDCHPTYQDWLWFVATRQKLESESQKEFWSFAFESSLLNLYFKDHFENTVWNRICFILIFPNYFIRFSKLRTNPMNINSIKWG